MSEHIMPPIELRLRLHTVNQTFPDMPELGVVEYWRADWISKVGDKNWGEQKCATCYPKAYSRHSFVSRVLNEIERALWQMIEEGEETDEPR